MWTSVVKCTLSLRVLSSGAFCLVFCRHRFCRRGIPRLQYFLLQYFLIINIADIKTNTTHIQSVANRNLLQPTAEPDYMFAYKEPPVAGKGTYEEEMRRYRLFLYRHGVICTNIRHFGGHYRKGYDPPENDPDGAWYLCVDPEASLTPGSCIVYSIG